MSYKSNDHCDPDVKRLISILLVVILPGIAALMLAAGAANAEDETWCPEDGTFRCSDVAPKDVPNVAPQCPPQHVIDDVLKRPTPLVHPNTVAIIGACISGNNLEGGWTNHGWRCTKWVWGGDCETATRLWEWVVDPVATLAG